MAERGQHRRYNGLISLLPLCQLAAATLPFNVEVSDEVNGAAFTQQAHFGQQGFLTGNGEKKNQYLDGEQ